MTRNATSSAPAAASSPSVWAVTQPTSLPFTIAYTPSISAAVGRNEQEREDDDGDPDGDVDEEDPVPVEDVGENAAEKDTDRAPARGDEPEDAHRLRALGGLGEERHRE